MIPLVALGISCLCIVLPFRLIIQAFCVKEFESEDYNESYNGKVMKFPTDYDKENPLTKQRGNERLLKMQIAEAEKNGNTEKVKALTG